MKENLDLISVLQASFASGLPNGWQLGWDRERFGADLKRIAGDRRVINVTSFDYSRCNSYEIECSNVGNQLVLTVRISFVRDLFILHWTQYSPNRRSGQVVQEIPDACAEIEGSVAEFLHCENFRRVPDDLYEQHVPNVELELSEPGDVTVGKCLFDDYDG